MGHFCCVTGCSNESTRTRHLSYYKLRTFEKEYILRKWIHLIGRKDLPINKETRVCFEHFINAHGWLLRPNKVPSLKLPFFKPVNSKRKPPRQRLSLSATLVTASCSSSEADHSGPLDGSIQTETYTSERKLVLLQEISMLKELLKLKEEQLLKQKFRLENLFYTGFQSYALLKVFFEFLGSAVDNLL